MFLLVVHRRARHRPWRPCFRMTSLSASGRIARPYPAFGNVTTGMRAMLKPTYPYYLANEARQPNTDLEVTDKYTGAVATRVAMADAKAIDAGIAAAVEAQDACRKMAPYQR